MASFVVAVILLMASDHVNTLFVSSPAEISPGKTSTVSLRCEPSLDNVDIILAIQIRKDDSKDADSPQTEGGVKAEQAQNGNNQVPIQGNTHARRKKRSTDESFVEATVTRKGTTTLPPSTRFTASGQTSVPAFLSVTFANPAEIDLGLYYCEITFLDNSMTMQKTSEQTKIAEGAELSQEDLQKRVTKLETLAPIVKGMVDEVRALLDETRMVTKMADEQMKSMKAEHEELFKNQAELHNQMGYLHKQLVTAQRSGALGKGGQGDQAQDDAEGKTIDREAVIMEEMTYKEIRDVTKRLDEYKEYLVRNQERLNALDHHLYKTVLPTLEALEKKDYKGLAERVEVMEMQTIPMLMKNVADCQKGLADLQNRFTAEAQPVTQPPATTTTTITTTTTRKPETTTTQPPEQIPADYHGPACYVCGNNQTQEPCTQSTKEHIGACPPMAPNCITRIYQNGHDRDVYKQCGTIRECLDTKKMSSPDCATENFMMITESQCHYCCESRLCNYDLRPENNVV